MIKKAQIKNGQSKLTLAKETMRRLNPLSSEALDQAAGGSTGNSGTSGLSPCGPGHYGTLHCSVGGGRGTCMAFPEVDDRR